jgi:hypothetical protein
LVSTFSPVFLSGVVAVSLMRVSPGQTRGVGRSPVPGSDSPPTARP